jgi:hypothetical protein
MPLFSIAPWLSEADLKSFSIIGCVSSTPCWRILPCVFSGLWILWKCVFINLIISCLVLLYSQSVLYSTCLTWIVGLVESCTVNSWQFPFYSLSPSTWCAVYPISNLPTASLISLFHQHMELTFRWGHGIWNEMQLYSPVHERSDEYY